MRFFKGKRKSMENRNGRETEYLQAGDFWLLLFVSVVILLFVFKFYA